MEKGLCPPELRNALDSKANVMLLDVRRAEAKAAGKHGSLALVAVGFAPARRRRPFPGLALRPSSGPAFRP